MQLKQKNKKRTGQVDIHLPISFSQVPGVSIGRENHDGAYRNRQLCCHEWFHHSCHLSTLFSRPDEGSHIVNRDTPAAPFGQLQLPSQETLKVSVQKLGRLEGA